MLSTNNEINVKKKERKYSCSTVFAWLFLKTIGRILPRRWNRWAENILYYDKVTADNEVETNVLKKVDKSVQVDFKPEVAEKKGQTGVTSKDGAVQTNRVTSQDMATQAGFVGETGKNIEVDLESEREKKLKDESEKLKGELEGANQELKAFVKLCDNQAQQIVDLQLGNGFLEEENVELKSKLAGLKKNYRKLTEDADKRGKEFLANLKEKSKTIVKLQGESIKLKAEFRSETRRLSLEAKEKEAKINILMLLNEALEQDRKGKKDKIDEHEIEESSGVIKKREENSRRIDKIVSIISDMKMYKDRITCCKSLQNCYTREQKGHPFMSISCQKMIDIYQELIVEYHEKIYQNLSEMKVVLKSMRQETEFSHNAKKLVKVINDICKAKQVNEDFDLEQLIKCNFSTLHSIWIANSTVNNFTPASLDNASYSESQLAEKTDDRPRTHFFNDSIRTDQLTKIRARGNI